MGRRIRVGVDTGGTFTDVVGVDADTGETASTKTPSTPAEPGDGFLTGVRKILELMGAGPADLAAVCHGTTVATNQLLEGRTGRLGLITTEGFEFLLEIARQSVPDGYGNSYFWVKPPRIVPAELVRGVGGRLDHTGAEIRPFDEASARAAARFLRDAGVTAVGVCFLHAYANPDHEERMRAVLAVDHPAAAVSVSHQVLREYREYERAMTTLVDAAVKPTVGGYVATIRARLHDLAGDVPFSIMKSNGGVVSAAEVVHHPVSTVLSGPAAGALGAAYAVGGDRLLTLDGGGTSTDVCVVRDGEPTLTTEGSVGGYPSRIPMIDVVTVGAGGGSVARLSREGTLKVGPRSAGAEPGPICYRRGGTEPTVTDAHLVLGRIPAHLLGGEVPLNPEAARDGLAGLAGKLDLDVERLAAGILEVSAWNQANALRQVTVKRGLDLRDFTLVTFGGSGSLLVCRLLDILGVGTAVVPRDPGNLSAYGLLTVDAKVDAVQTYVVRHDALDPAAVERHLALLAERATAALRADGYPDVRCTRSADLRYFGQAYEVPVPYTGPETTVAAFHDAHERRYGYCFRGRPEQPVEWVNLRVTGVGPIARPRPRRWPRPAHPARPAGVRPVWFDDGYAPATVWWRPDLGAGSTVAGPAVIEEYGATVPVQPGFAARVDDAGSLVVTRDAG